MLRGVFFFHRRPLPFIRPFLLGGGRGYANTNATAVAAAAAAASSLPSEPKRRVTWVDDPNEAILAEDEMIRRLVQLRRVVKVTKGGKVRSTSALVLVGNGQGGVGYAFGKAELSRDAIDKAVRTALKSMEPVPFDRQRSTLHHNIEATVSRTRVRLWARPPGSGIKAHRAVNDLLTCAGINDVGAKVFGGRSPANVIRATLKALSEQLSPEEFRFAKGDKVRLEPPPNRDPYEPLRRQDVFPRNKFIKKYYLF